MRVMDHIAMTDQPTADDPGAVSTDAVLRHEPMSGHDMMTQWAVKSLYIS